MSTTTANNGKPQRKQLSDQLDRLDGIIDALAEGLNGAVADAAREGTRLAVKDAVIEIISNPELRTLLTSMQSQPAPQPKKPSLWNRLKAKLAAAREAFKIAAQKVTVAVATPFRSAIETVNAIGKMAGESLSWKRVLLVGVVTGVAIAGVCLVTPHWVAATIGAVGGAVSSVAAQTGIWLKRVARGIGLVG